MKAVLFAPGLDRSLDPLTRFIPRAMVPILNRPMLEYYVLQARKAGIKEIRTIVHDYSEQIERYFKDGLQWDVNISYALEKDILGDFRSLRKIRSSISSAFLFIDTRFFVFTDVQDIIEKHKKSKALLSVVFKKFMPFKNHFSIEYEKKTNELLNLKPIKASDKNSVENILIGFYVFEPEILSYLDDGKIHSIAQDLIPYLLKNKQCINVIKMDGAFDPMTTLYYYWKLNMSLLDEGILNKWILSKPFHDKIYVGQNCDIKSRLNENIIAPVLIGDNTIISGEVNLRGPVIIGNNVKIDKGATVDRSIILDNTYVGKRVGIRKSVVAKNCYISIRNLFATFVEENFIISEYREEPFKFKMERFIMSLIDRLTAFCGLIFFSPLFLFIIILIKLNSKGPVFYTSKHLKRAAQKSKSENHYRYIKEDAFKYYVFRTKYIDAHHQLKEKEAKNFYKDGKYFETKNNLKVTRIGKFLIKSGLDKLPLLINVLKGDMRLVSIWNLPGYGVEKLFKSGLKTKHFDLSEVSQIQFNRELSLAGFLQAQGFSNLTTEEQTTGDAVQSIPITLSNNEDKPLDEYQEFVSLKGYLRLLGKTFITVIKRRST